MYVVFCYPMKILILVIKTITQVLQERVEEERRGVLNGVQVTIINDLFSSVLEISQNKPDCSFSVYFLRQS